MQTKFSTKTYNAHLSIASSSANICGFVFNVEVYFVVKMRTIIQQAISSVLIMFIFLVSIICKFGVTFAIRLWNQRKHMIKSAD